MKLIFCIVLEKKWRLIKAIDKLFKSLIDPVRPYHLGILLIMYSSTEKYLSILTNNFSSVPRDCEISYPGFFTENKFLLEIITGV